MNKFCSDRYKVYEAKVQINSKLIREMRGMRNRQFIQSLRNAMETKVKMKTYNVCCWIWRYDVLVKLLKTEFFIVFPSYRVVSDMK